MLPVALGLAFVVGGLALVTGAALIAARLAAVHVVST
jgi:hypothetical protein